MANTTNWLPRNHQELYDQATMTVDYLTEENLERMGISGSGKDWFNNTVVVKYNKFGQAFDDWKNSSDRTVVKIAALEAAEADFNNAYRQLYNGYLRNGPLVTDEDLISMGLPKRPSGGRTPTPAPTTVVEATVDTSVPAIISVNYHDKDKKGTAKPKGVHGVEIAWEILGAPPTDWSELTHSAFDTRTPAQLVFSGEQRGKTLYFALRWENNKGDKGPWSVIYNAIIP
jgi:hypothetical protein